MKTKFLLPAALLTGVALMCLTDGCTIYAPEPAPGVNAEVTVTDDPPPLIAESVPASPGLDYVWIGGAWAWHGHWVWEHGRWAHPPHPGAVWVAHRYENRDGHRVFIQGGWR